jgi:hypothetical protein
MLAPLKETTRETINNKHHGDPVTTVEKLGIGKGNVHKVIRVTITTTTTRVTTTTTRARENSTVWRKLHPPLPQTITTIWN